MSSAVAYTFAVVCEAAADLRLSSGLADRVLCQQVEWIDPTTLDLHRRWRGLEENASHIEWHWVSKLAKQLSIRAHGHFRDEPGTLDAAMARKALLVLARAQEPPDAVILVRDTDGREERRRGFDQARQVSSWPFAVVLAVAHTKGECWILAGFNPQSEKEEQVLIELRQELGFDPRLQAENLTAAEAQAPRNAKRVLHRLLAGSQERGESCWKETDLGTLRKRGRQTGLADYLDELLSRLVPLFTTGSISS